MTTKNKVATANDEDERWAKMPRWARAERDTWRRRAIAAEHAANEARLATSPAESDTLLAPYESVPIGLGCGERVRFLPNGPGSAKDIRCWVDVQVTKRGVEVMGGDSLIVAPHSSNLIYVTVIP